MWVGTLSSLTGIEFQMEALENSLIYSLISQNIGPQPLVWRGTQTPLVSTSKTPPSGGVFFFPRTSG